MCFGVLKLLVVSVVVVVTLPRCKLLRWLCLYDYLCVFFLLVYLSAGISKKWHVHTSWNFLCVLPVAVARSSSNDQAVHYVLPVLWMTSCLPIISDAHWAYNLQWWILCQGIAHILGAWNLLLAVAPRYLDISDILNNGSVQDWLITSVKLEELLSHVIALQIYWS